MALKAVYDMVLNRLSFIPLTGWETKVGDFQLEQQYYLDTFLQKGEKDPVEDVEDEANWKGMERILLAEITAYQLLTVEIIKTLGGDAESNTSVGAASKMIKSAKADVVEAEFEYAKADDGRTLALKAKELIPELKANVCRYGQSLGFYLPGYCDDIPDIKCEPPFIVTNP